MKKLCVSLVLLGLAAGAQALDFTVGAGASASYTVRSLDAGAFLLATLENSLTAWPIDFKGSFDATYVRADVGYRFVSGRHEDIKGAVLLIPLSSSSEEISEFWSYLSLAAYAKLPFTSGALTTSPLLGVEYDVSLAYTDSAGNDLKASLTDEQRADLNEIWIKGGIETVIWIFGNFFIKPELIAGFKLLNATDVSLRETAQASTPLKVSLSYWSLQVGLLIGYTF